MARRNEMAFRDDDLDVLTGQMGELMTNEMAFKEQPRRALVSGPDGAQYEGDAVGSNVTRQGGISTGSIATARQSVVVYISVGNGTGTGFYAKYNDKHCIVTNNHVITSAGEARTASCYFDFEAGRRGQKEIKLKPDGLFLTFPDPYDFTIVQVADARQVAQRPPIPLHPKQVKKGDTIIIVQHPGGSPKTQTTGKITSFLDWQDKGDMAYTADTLPGSSGSPVFDSAWNLVGIHHHGDGRARVNGGTSVVSMFSCISRSR